MKRNSWRRGIIIAALTIGIMVRSWAQDVVPLAQARWISAGFPQDSLRPSASVFFRSWELIKPIKNATLFITAHGLYEAAINDKKVGEGFLTPGYTHYHKRLQYQRYDITRQVHPGRNTFSATVADGWWRGAFGGDLNRNIYGKDASLLYQLDIVYTDGTTQSIVSGDSTRCGPSPVRYSDLYEGETVDTRYRTILQPVQTATYTKDQLIESNTPPVSAHESFTPRRIWKAPNGDQLVDFGQNLAGWVSIKIKGHAGDTIRIAHAEMLDTLGNLFTGNLRSAKATDTYICDGTEQTLHPTFTYHGFRYIRVSGIDARQARFTAVAVYTDLPKTGSFTCSDTLLNQLQHNINWSLNSNFVDIPTDCPQRSERLGWTGDAQIFCATAAFNRDIKSFYTKWYADLSASQGDDGSLHNVVPSPYDPLDTAEKGGAAGWGDAATIVPWTLYERYGDTGLLRRQYKTMQYWVEHIQRQSPDGLWKAPGYGDWYAPGDRTSIPFIDQCFYIHSTELLVRAAILLGLKPEAEYYGSLLVNIKKAFLDAYGQFDTKETSTQTAYTLALAFDLLPEADRQKIADRLAKKIKENGDHLATGFLGTPYLLPVLSRYGYTDLAYALLLQKTCPSWLYPITRGATTIWERWSAIRPDGSIENTSFNHYAYGAVGQWMYETIAGIQPAAPGYKKIRIAPQPGGTLQWAKASYRCNYGTIISEWKKQGNQVKYHIMIPNGTTAIIELPGQPVKNVGPGNYSYVTPDKFIVD